MQIDLISGKSITEEYNSLFHTFKLLHLVNFKDKLIIPFKTVPIRQSRISRGGMIFYVYVYFYSS